MKTALHAVAAATVSLLSVALPAQTPAAPRPWTFMVYAAVDNDAENTFFPFLEKIRRAIDDDPGIELLVFVDRSDGFTDDATVLGADFAGARVYRAGRSAAERVDLAPHFPDAQGDDPEVDSADPRTLGRFVALCKDRFPARHFGLMLFGHANGATMCPDDESGRSMSIPALGTTVGADASVDLLALELCNMGGVEIAYEWRPGHGGFGADVLVAIPNSGIPLDWDRAFARIRSPGHETPAPGEALDPEGLTAAAFGRLLIEEGLEGRKAKLAEMVGAGMVDLERMQGADFLREAAGCYDLTAVAAVKQELDSFARQLAQDDARAAFLQLNGADGDGILHYAPKGKFANRPYVDLWALMDRAARCDDLSAEARAHASAARDATDRMVLASFGVEHGFGTYLPGRHGIFVVCPDGSEGSWRRLWWYTPLHAATGRDLGGWAFLADGATAGNGTVENWFELLDAWFDDPSTDPAGLNGYAW